MFNKKICVMGLGYIGLPTAAILATKGYNVIGVDISQSLVNTISKGEINILEPDLDIVVKSAINSNKLKVSLTPEEADVFFISVPTPFKESYKPDISYIESATKSILPYLRKGNLVILESTSPIGTTEYIGELLKESRLNIGKELFIAHAPERVLLGHTLKEIIENDRIIGGVNKKSSEVCKKFYNTFVKGEIFITDAKTAELTKLVENSYRDVNIAFANELDNICSKLDVNVWELIKLANKHPRVNILSPGPGVGGHCLAVDPWFIVDAAKDEAKLIKRARITNEARPDIITKRVLIHANRFKKPVVGALGISYKPDIDDIRESPALEVVEKLSKLDSIELLVHDPYIKSHKHLNFKTDDLNTIIEKSDILVLLVHHKEYFKIDKSRLREKILIDTRGIWESN